MIIGRSPLRISLGGGGTDLPSYSNHHGGYLIAAAINKYVYVSANRPFQEEINLKYSKIESVKRVNEIQHPIIREVLRTLELESPQIELSSVADIPAGTGLGSSGSFTTALIKTLYTHYKRNIHPKELAELACKIEIEVLKEPIGKQDQYIAAFGGISEFTFHQDGTVSSNPLKLSIETIHNLEDNLLLFFTGISRSASSILIDQVNQTSKNDQTMIQNLHFVKELGVRSRDSLIKGDLREFGEIMNEHWMYKKSRSGGMSNSFINDIYQKAIKAGATGGKLVGAGGGGFLMFYADDSEKLRLEMSKQGLEEVRFQFDFEGTKVILS
jgi:D-glycero-alpha-D-manno-heptose-7-phosphate kinase